jgi:hypothetical protein
MTVMDISAEKAEALRGQLDHLRKIGVPKLEKTGSGRKTGYTFADGFEILIALRLERTNCPPLSAKVGAKKARAHIRDAVGSRPSYLLYDPGEGYIVGDKLLRDRLLDMLQACVVVDLRRSFVELNTAWQAELDRRH